MMMDTSGLEKRRHRSWPDALKREVVAAASEPGASVSVVARRYDVNANLVFTWRKRFGADMSSAAAPQFLPVMVTPDQPSGAPASCNPAIEIEHPRGYRIRLSGEVKAAALRLVLDVLDRR